MLIFHEGLPGSGKSYEAIAARIVPALVKRRPVDAYVEGLDHVKLATLAGITEEECRTLLVALTREQVPEVHRLSRDNALIVLDEAQNFWGNRAKLSQELTQYVTEHRHRGQDIVLMGQDMRDVHTLWRRRVELKLMFTKLTAFGTSKRYSCTTTRRVGPDDFEKVGTQITKYDPKYFGCYKSHVSGDTNTSDYKEQRATIWRHPLIRYGLPCALLLALWGAQNAYTFFRPEPKQAKQPQQLQQPARNVAQASNVSAPGAPQLQAAPVPPDTRSAQERQLAKMSTDYRIRLAGLITRGNRVQGLVEWVDSGTRVIERLTIDQLRDLGVAVAAGDGYVRFELGEWKALATMWPMEGIGRTSEATLANLRPAPEPAPAQAVFIGTRVSREDRQPSAPLTEDKPRGRPG